jgi:hypothetical protein
MIEEHAPTDFHVAHAGLCFFDATTNLKETINKAQNLTTKEHLGTPCTVKK